MPVAAVPKYLPHNEFQKASPALRFGMLLGIWTSREDQKEQLREMAGARSPQAETLQNMINQQGENTVLEYLINLGRIPRLWEKNDFGAKRSWNDIKVLTSSDRDRIRAIAKRQEELVKAFPENRTLQLQAISTAPFTTGLGNEHPLENGFAFLNPYGVPYLPASGVKGVLRQTARELAEGLWGDTRGWSTQQRYSLTVNEGGEEKTVPLSMLDVLFGRETDENATEHLRGVLTFWDVIPEIEGDSLLVEIMTPHQSHYYQQNEKEECANSTTPHESGQPTPIHFLTVPPGSVFRFFVTCDILQLRRLAPDLAGDDYWKKLLQAAFEHAFKWLGFGAKTAVAKYFGKRLQKSKRTTTSNWANPRLTERQILYAANDAQVALRVYRAALSDGLNPR